ncbi:hypothetical protein HJFPF1_12028 [Paramyrothecium foliicola]|nr:hypothetical protein HJFPF1_12028 [Paramyrothecium foliicola]
MAWPFQSLVIKLQQQQQRYSQTLTLYLAAAIPLASAYRITADGVNCRSGPSTSHGIVRTYAKNTDVAINCQVHGQNINGITLWDKTSAGCYVSDYYVNTGTNGMVAKDCNSSGGSGGGYPITADGVNCRKGPSTSHGVVKTYKKNTKVQISCQVYGQNINGITLWDKTSDGCYVSDYYVYTGTDNMVAKNCNGNVTPPGGGGSSAIEGPIKRSEIMSRAQYWISRGVPYSMDASHPDVQGARYRTDCSGFVSMALHLKTPGLSTVYLPGVAKAIGWADLRQGDFVGTLGSGTGGAGGHVTLFDSWTDSSKKRYNTLECMWPKGCIRMQRDINWRTDAGFTAKPFRYIRVAD